MLEVVLIVVEMVTVGSHRLIRATGENCYLDSVGCVLVVICGVSVQLVRAG